jgi:3'-phosphoadenosine 5'-phosphosulfate (PAPS) 3'-phosphatase
MSVSLKEPVADLIRAVAAEVILPRFQNLAAHEVMEKAADDLVTVADRESEARLMEGLARLLPEASIVGEEACAADPSLLAALSDTISAGSSILSTAQAISPPGTRHSALWSRSPNAVRRLPDGYTIP